MFNIGEKIVNLRKENNLTQDELANKLNVSRQSISKWESGLSLPEISNLLLISEIFNCTIDSLLLEETTPLEVPKESFETFGERLIYLRKKHHMSQELLADALEVSRQAIFKYEKNLIYPDLDKIIKISNLYNCSIDYLLKEKENEACFIKNKVKDNECKQKKSWIHDFLIDHILNIVFIACMIIWKILLPITIHAVTFEYVLVRIFPILISLRFIVISLVYKEKRFSKELMIFGSSLAIYIPYLLNDVLINAISYPGYFVNLPIGIAIMCLFLLIFKRKNKLKHGILFIYFSLLGSFNICFSFLYIEYYSWLFQMFEDYVRTIAIIIMMIYILYLIYKNVVLFIKSNNVKIKIVNVSLSCLGFIAIIFCTIFIMNSPIRVWFYDILEKNFNFYVIVMTIFSSLLFIDFRKKS